MTTDSIISNINKIQHFDLNLLLTFEAVYFYQSASKAAEFLNVSPPAVSQSLAKLRLFFSDPLFLRNGNGLVRTTIAENLHMHLKSNLSQLLDSLSAFSDESTKTQFSIYAAPYIALRFLPQIYAEAEEKGMNFDISHTSANFTTDEIENVLALKKSDIIFDIRPFHSSSTVSEPLVVEKTVAICRKDHPRLKSTLTKEEMAKEKSTFLNIEFDGIKKMRSEMDDFFSKRSFTFSSSSLIVHAGMIEKSNNIGFVPEWFVNKFITSFNLKVLECNFNPAPITIYAIYNKSSLKNNNFTALLRLINNCKSLS